MKSIRIPGRAFTGLGILVWSALNLPVHGQTSGQIGAALEETSLTWNSTGWTVGMLVRGRADAMVGTWQEAEAPVLQTTITGPAKLVFDWTVQNPLSIAVLGLSVDGHELELETSNQYWRCIELQIPAGAHTVAWRPLAGATIYLDNVIYDPGQTMGFVLGLNDGDTGVWAVHTGSFSQTAAAARDGLTSTAQLVPDQDGRAVAYRLAGGLPTQAVALSYWQRQVGNGHGASASPILSVMGDYHYDFSSWQFHERVAAAGTWIKVEGNFLPGVPLPGALYLDDFKVEPRTLSWALDCPELTWTSTSPDGVPWQVAEGAAPGAADGRAEAWHDGPFEATLTTTLQGPALFTLNHLAYSFDGASLVPSLNGVLLAPFITGGYWTGPEGTWRRETITLPKGASTLSLRAGETTENGGSCFVDQCNLLTPAAPPVAQALLGSGPALSVWSSQSGSATRDEGVVRSAGGATVCLTPERGRVSEILLEMTGPAVLSFWAKADPGATLQVYAGTENAGDLAPYGGGGWEMKTLQIPDGPQHMHLIAGTARVWLDELMSIQTVPVATALDVSSDIPGVAELTGASMEGAFAAQLPPGSGAVGDDAVIFPLQGPATLFIPFNSFPCRIRFRQLGDASLYLGYGRSPGYSQHTSFHNSTAGPEQWSEADVVISSAATIGNWENGHLIFHGNGAWLDNLRIDSIVPRPWVEAAVPTAIVPTGWQAFDKVDRLGGICAVSTVAGNGYSPVILPLSIAGPCDISAFWRRGQSSGPNFLFRCGAQSLTQSSTSWQPLHVHMDEATSVSFVVNGNTYDRLHGGEGMVDDVSIIPRNAMTFSQVLDTNIPGATIQSPGWTAVGTAIATTKSAETFDGTDALTIHPDFNIRGPQKVELRASFNMTGFFHLRARRSGSGNEACAVSWDPGNGTTGSRALTLTPEWALTSECVNGSEGTTITIEVTVDGDDRESAVVLDTFGWDPAPATGVLLEAAAFTEWISAPANTWTGSCHPTPTGGSASAMEVTALAPGARATLTGNVTGPGFVVFRSAAKGVYGVDYYYTLEVAVDETVVLSRDRTGGYYHTERVDQLFVPEGTHSVSWSVVAGANNTTGSIRLLSVALVPGTELALLTERLPASDGWSFGGDFLPQPLYNLSEGIVTPGGVSLPASSSWIQRSVTGPSEVNVGWYSDADYYAPFDPGRFTIDGHDAGETARNSYDSIAGRDEVTKGVSIPPGTHDFRWSRAFDDGTTIALGPCMAGPPVISAEDAGYVIWINEGSSEYRWKSVTGNAFTGDTALSARDTAHGECLVTGPGVLRFMLAQDGRSIFSVRGQNQDSYYYSSDAHNWQYVSLLIPPGQQRIRFTESYCEPTDGTEIAWLDDMHFTPGGFAEWRASTLSDLEWGGHWEYFDSDEDGVPDVMEYAFGTNATKETPWASPRGTLVNGQFQLQFPALPYTTTGLRYAVDGSSDMVHWSEIGVVSASAPHAAGPVITIPAATRSYVRARVLIE